MSFEKMLNDLNLVINDNQLEQFETYFKFLVEYNEKVNLTAITIRDDVYLKHFYDSLTLTKAYDFSGDLTLCDVGAGAGFPSIPLKIMFPNIKLTIVDSLGKRITFLNLLAEKLNLDNYNMVHARAEEYAVLYRESFDVVTSRAVARQNVLNELCLPLTKVGGYFLSMKSKLATEEKSEGESFEKLFGKIEDTFVFKLLDGSEREIVKIKHFNKTPNMYPREFSKIKKNPL